MRQRPYRRYVCSVAVLAFLLGGCAGQADLPIEQPIEEQQGVSAEEALLIETLIEDSLADMSAEEITDLVESNSIIVDALGIGEEQLIAILTGLAGGSLLASPP